MENRIDSQQKWSTIWLKFGKRFKKSGKLVRPFSKWMTGAKVIYNHKAAPELTIFCTYFSLSRWTATLFSTVGSPILWVLFNGRGKKLFHLLSSGKCFVWMIYLHKHCIALVNIIYMSSTAFLGPLMVSILRGKLHLLPGTLIQFHSNKLTLTLDWFSLEGNIAKVV